MPMPAIGRRIAAKLEQIRGRAHRAAMRNGVGAILKTRVGRKEP